MDKNKWFPVAISCMAVSVLSLFSSIFIYRTPNGRMIHYNLIDLLFETSFMDDVLFYYTGPVLWEMGGATVSVLACIAVAAVACALIGLFTLRKQRPNTWQFVLTLVGLLGTSFPSFLVILAVILSENYFPGNLTCGYAPIITPIAMVTCMMVVVRRRNKVLEQLQKEMQEKGLVFRAGDM